MKKTIVLTVIFFLLVSCKNREISTAAFYNYSTECLGKSMDGKQTLRVWASGRNRTDAIEQAKKKAVYDVVFSGIQSGNGECNAYPVVDESNARKKYEDYFDLFFSDGGAYKAYVTTSNHKKSSIVRLYGDGTQTLGIIVTVDRSALRKRLENDNIIVR